VTAELATESHQELAQMKNVSQLAEMIRREIFARFLEPHTRQLCTYPWHGREDITPTADEMARSIPSMTGYGTGIEDGALKGGTLLGLLADEYEVTRDPEIKVQAATLFAGLRRLANAGDPAGFVPRWVLADGRSCYPSSSIDQHTLLPYGLWRYLTSDLPTDSSRADIGLIVGRIVERIRDDGWRVTTTQGGDAHAGGSIDGLGPRQSVRLLSLLLAAHAATESGEWLDLYERKACEEGSARLRGLADSSELLGAGGGYYGPEQTSLLLRLLSEGDPSDARRDVFRRARTDLARRYLGQGFPGPRSANEHRHQPTYSRETLAVLGDAAYLPSPFVIDRFRPDLWGVEEDLSWRAYFREWIDTQRGNSTPTEYVLSWFGQLPALCHEKNCVRFPLTAFNAALLSENRELIDRVHAPSQQLLVMADLRKAINLGTLIEGLSVCVMSMRHTEARYVNSISALA